MIERLKIYRNCLKKDFKRVVYSIINVKLDQKFW